MGAVVVVVAGATRGGPIGVKRQVGIAMGADMIKLLEDHRALFVHRVGDASKMGDDLIGRVAEVAAGEHSGGMHGHWFHYDHACPAHGAFAVVGNMLIPWQPVTAHVGGVGAKDHAVSQGFMAQLHGFEHMGVSGHSWPHVSESL